MASAIGATDCCEPSDDADVQRIAANTIDAYMAKTVLDRTHARFLQVADRLSTGEFGSIALAAVLHTSRDRDNRGGGHDRRLNNNRFYDSNLSDRETRPSPPMPGREWHWCDDHGRWE